MDDVYQPQNVNSDYANNRIKIVKARRNFLDFVTYTKKDYHVNWHHKLICDNLNDFMTNPDRTRLMIFAPPRIGKSEVVSRRFPAYCFGHFPDMEIISASYGADLAQAMSRDLQRVIDNDLYRDVFPDTQLSGKNVATTSLGSYIRTADKFEIVGHKGKYKSAGVGGALTGSGADILIIDDPTKGMKEALSPTIQKATWDWYTSVASTRLSKEGKVIIMLTRWHEKDLAGMLLAKSKADPNADQWEVLCYPMEYEKEHPHVNKDDPRKKEGELLWPSWFPEKRVSKTKGTSGTRVYSSLYQQRPSPASGSIFQISWFNYFKELPEFEYIAASWDFTFKGTDTSDFVAGAVFGVKGANKYLIYLVRERLSFVQTVKEVIRLQSMFPNLRCQIIEDKANGPAVIDTLKDKIKALVTYTPHESKESRYNAVSPQFEAGNIWLPDQYYEPNRIKFPWMMREVGSMKMIDVITEEFKNAPFGANDDIVDCFAQFLLKMGTTNGWLNQLISGTDINPSTPYEIAEKKKNEDIAALMGWSLPVDDAEDFDLSAF